MPFGRKCILGPETSIPCVSCGKRIGIPWGAIAAAIPFAFGMVGALRLSFPWLILSGLGGIAAYLLIQWFFVPIVRRDVESRMPDTKE
jgi:hypothetical protein